MSTSCAVGNRRWRIRGHGGMPANAAVLGDRSEQRGRSDPAVRGDLLEHRVDLGELGAVEHVAAIRERVEWLDPAQQPAMMLIVPVGAIVVVVALRNGRWTCELPSRALPSGNASAPLGERARCGQRFGLEERGDFAAELERGVAVVREIERDERVGPAHDPEPDLRVALVARSISGVGSDWHR